MGIEDGTTTFTLSRPIEYRVNGQPEFTDQILLKEPGMDHIKYYLKLKQMIMQAQFGMMKAAGDLNTIREQIGEEVKPFTEDVTALEAQTPEIEEGITLCMEASEKADLPGFVATFEAMACLKGRTSVCMIDGKQAMTAALWATLKPDDALKIAVRWCAFFVMPSAGGVKISSGQP